MMSAVKIMVLVLASDWPCATANWYTNSTPAVITRPCTILIESSFQLKNVAVNGRDLVTGIPKQIMVSYQEVADALDKSVFKIEEAILKALEKTPPELAADIFRRGLYLTGGGALLRGLDKRIAQKIKLPVHVADDPLRSVVRGTGMALKHVHKFPFLMQ